MYRNVLILHFPKVSMIAPPLAPALLGAICERNNIAYSFIDCNSQVHQTIDPALNQEVLVDYAEYLNSNLSAPAQNWLNNYFKELAVKCCDYDLIAISVFSNHSSNLVKYFLENFRNNFTADVVVGGAGLNVSDWSPGESNVPFYRYLSDRNLINYWILGEGEIAFENLLQGNTQYPGINSVEYNFLDDFSATPIPSFDAYDLAMYVDGLSDKKIISIEGSRGCVKNCTFCDIKKIWGNYKFKNGVALADEILELSNKYNVDHFWFNDSLVNGSLKVFRDFLTHLTAYKQNRQFTWSGQAIVRSKTPRDHDDFKLLKSSGCETLVVGLESFSQRVRYHMTKNFTDDDLDNFLNLAQQYGIKVFLLLIVGYPIETQEDFDISIKQLEKYQHLADDGTISAINLGTTLSIIQDTPLDHMKESMKIVYPINTANGFLWTLNNNTIEQRIQWRVGIEEHARRLGYNCVDDQFDVEQSLLSLWTAHQQ